MPFYIKDHRKSPLIIKQASFKENKAIFECEVCGLRHADVEAKWVSYASKFYACQECVDKECVPEHAFRYIYMTGAHAWTEGMSTFLKGEYWTWDRYVAFAKTIPSFNK